MSAVAIIRNIFQFAKILNKASQTTVTQWDNTSIVNALNWADYCTEVYRYVKGRDFEDDVNNQLSQMTMLIEPVSCLTLSVENLVHAKHLLVEILMSNPNFAPTSKAALVSALQRDPDSRLILEQVQEKLSRLQQESEMCLGLLVALEGEENSNKAFDILGEKKAEYEAKVLMQHLIFTVHGTKKLERFHKYCHALCDKLSETQQGYNIVVHCFCVEASYLPDDAEIWIETILDNLLLWVKHQMKEDFESCPLWKVNHSILCKASCASKQFFGIYLENLTKWTDLFYPELHHQHQQVFCDWKCPSGQSIETLTCHFRSLLLSFSASQEETTTILKVLSDKVKETDFTAWQTLAEALVRDFKKRLQ